MEQLYNPLLRSKLLRLLVALDRVVREAEQAEKLARHYGVELGIAEQLRGARRRVEEILKH